jgi:NAD(P)-dependent dehydrogenase (short-subunit alcohol dehydrogenase family)
MQIAGKVVVVTGGASGIGRALCERFARDGAKGVCVADLDEGAGKQVADSVGGMFVRCDVGSEAEVKRLIAETEQRFGPIDLYVSNAGMAFWDGPAHVADSKNEDWTKIWEVNVMAHVYAARALLPAMLARGAEAAAKHPRATDCSGYFLITASAAGLLHQVGSAAYSVTKHGAVAFAESLAISHADQGIGVSLLCPQGVWTNMTKWVKRSPKGADAMLNPEDVADAVVKGIAERRFLILSHPVTQEYIQNKAKDYDAWIRGMARAYAKQRAARS